MAIQEQNPKRETARWIIHKAPPGARPAAQDLIDQGVVPADVYDRMMDSCRASWERILLLDEEEVLAELAMLKARHSAPHAVPLASARPGFVHAMLAQLRGVLASWRLPPLRPAGLTAAVAFASLCLAVFVAWPAERSDNGDTPAQTAARHDRQQLANKAPSAPPRAVPQAASADKALVLSTREGRVALWRPVAVASVPLASVKPPPSSAGTVSEVQTAAVLLQTAREDARRLLIATLESATIRPDDEGGVASEADAAIADANVIEGTPVEMPAEAKDFADQIQVAEFALLASAGGSPAAVVCGSRDTKSGPLECFALVTAAVPQDSPPRATTMSVRYGYRSRQNRDYSDTVLAYGLPDPASTIDMRWLER